MKKKLFIPALIAIVAFGLFLGISVVAKVYHNTDLPVQVMGAFLGAIVTAFITMMLLHGQSQAEELKERNVKVFEEKTKRYNNFIKELWKVWEDRKVTLEELNRLLEFVMKDVLLFTKSKTSSEILAKLNEIADIEFTNDKENDKEKITADEKRKKIQNCVFEIINLLAKEMDLGGKIEEKEREALNKIEGKIRPYLDYKKNKAPYKKRFLEDFEEVIKKNEKLGEVFFNKKWDGHTCISISIGKSQLSLMVGPIEKDYEDFDIMGFYIDGDNPNYQKHRQATRDWKRNFLKRLWSQAGAGIDLIYDFNNMDSVKRLVDAYKKADAEEDKKEKDKINPAIVLANRVIEYYNDWKSDDEQTIDQLIEECEGNKS